MQEPVNSGDNAKNSGDTATGDTANAGNAGDSSDPNDASKQRAEGKASVPDPFRNDPDEATNPNEAIERSRRNLRR